MTEKDFESLLTAYLDGSIQDDEIIELEKAVQKSHTLKTRFQEEFRLHTLMREAALTRRELNRLSVGRILLWGEKHNISFCVATAASAACILLSIILVVVLYGHSRDSRPVLGRLLQVSSTPHTTTGTEHHLILKDGQTVNEGDRIVCDPDMQSLIELNDGTLLSLEGDSIITLQRKQTDDVEIFVERGKVLFEVTKQDPNKHHMVVRTPQTTTTVLGTLFSVEVQNTWSRTDVFEGLVHVRLNQTGDEHYITERQRAETLADGTLQVQELSQQEVFLGTPQLVLSPTNDMHTVDGRIENADLLYVEGTRHVIYLKFEVPMLENTIHAAKLHLTQYRDVGKGTLCFYEGNHSNWTEQDQTADHLPKMVREIARFSGVVGIGQTIEVDVSDLITLPGLFTIIITLDVNGNDDIAFGSKELPIGPRLVINEPIITKGPQVSDIASGTDRLVTSQWPNCTIFKPTDDVYLQNKDRINREYLHLEKQRRTSFLRFEVSGQGVVEWAKLQLHQLLDHGSGTIRFYEGSHSDWTERDLTAYSAPFQVREIARYTGTVGPCDIISVDVSALVTGPGVYTIIATLDTEGEEDIAFGSKESSVSPKLILRWRQGDQ
jgi:hypothetical protein